ncbi:substrate-binding domain-containing protein [Planctomicrobium sp. SH661]|uniref:AraC family transcriptional regulator n=1 Tax=Planctomicrobium sp. SH661 TaxID=3448124 RepID=UPI003F5B7695
MSPPPPPAGSSFWNHRRVTLLIQTATDWSRQVLSGIARYADERLGWDCYLEPRGVDERMFLPRDWKADGVILRLTHPGLQAAIARKRIPAVNVSWLGEHSSTVPKVISDERGCGELAARFFLGKGFRSFASVGPRREGYSDLFEKSYQTLVEGFEYQRFVPRPGGPTRDRARLIKWLRGLSKPVALVVWDTNLGREVVLASLSASFQIPDQIAVLCLEAEPLVSSLCPVPLSYIDQDGDAVGYQAASVLESMMFGAPPPTEPILIPPIHVVERVSTDAVAVRDPLVARIMRYIRNRASSPIAVADLEREFDMSRRQLEHRFLIELGHSPAAEIRRVRLILVKDLLRKTNLTLEEIAARSGFQDPSVLIRSFQREAGQTPGEFRKSPRTIPRAEAPEN